MRIPPILPRLAVALWILLFFAAWSLSTLADRDTFWLAPAFFLPQFLLVAGLSFRSERDPWPWGPFLAAALPASSVIGLGVLFLVGSVLEAHDARMKTLPPVMVVSPLVVAAACFAWFLSLRQHPRRSAAFQLLSAVCASAVLSLIVSAAALPAAERQDAFLAGLVCRVSIALALIVLVWTLPGWIATLLLPVSPPGDR